MARKKEKIPEFLKTQPETLNRNYGLLKRLGINNTLIDKNPNRVNRQNLQRKLMGALLGAGLGISGMLGMSGCATTGSVGQNNLGYEFLDSNGDYKLVRRDNDIWIEKLDGTDSRQITHTPDFYEGGNFVDKGQYIIYSEDQPDGKTGRYFIIPQNEDDSNRKEISFEDYKNLWWRK